LSPAIRQQGITDSDWRREMSGWRVATRAAECRCCRESVNACLAPVETFASVVGTAFAHSALSMRRHHEALTAAILPAISMLIPAAGVLWTRWLSIRASSTPPEKAKSDS
jgi:hypothetical protein